MKKFIFILTIYVMLLAAACGSDSVVSSTSPGSIKFTAKLGSDYSKYDFSKLELVAVPMSGLHSILQWNGTGLIKKGKVNSDGSFDLTLDKKLVLTDGSTFPDGSHELDVDYVIIVIDKSSGKDEIVDFVAMNNFNISKAINLGGLASLGTVVRIKTGYADSDIDGGELTHKNENEAVSTSSTGGNFNLTEKQLSDLAMSDDVVKTIINDYRNEALETKVAYSWEDPVVSGNFDYLTTGYSKPVDFTFTAWGVSFVGRTGYAGQTAQDIMGSFEDIVSDKLILSLVPPGEFGEYSLSNPITTESITGSGTEYSKENVSLQLDEEENNMRFEIDGIHFTAYPEGKWLLQKKTVSTGTSETVGTFDFAVGSPFFGNDTTKIKTYVPSIKITVSGDSVTEIDIKWYLYDGSQYIEVTDYVTMLDGADWNYTLGGASGDLYSSGDLAEFSGTLTDDDFGTVKYSELMKIEIVYNLGPVNYVYGWYR